MNSPAIHVRSDDLSSAEVQALIAEHLAGMRGNTPAGQVHALAIDGLRQSGAHFMTAWLGTELCGCGAILALDQTRAELKSMRTRPAYLRRGVGQAVLDALVSHARRMGHRQLYLETGTGPAFAAAHALYLRNGFDWCGAFGSYIATEFNVFMVRTLDPPDDIPA